MDAITVGNKVCIGSENIYFIFVVPRTVIKKTSTRVIFLSYMWLQEIKVAAGDHKTTMISNQIFRRPERLILLYLINYVLM